MATAIYKQSQGYWTRMMSAIGAGLLTAMGAKWLWDYLEGINWPIESVYAAAIGVIIFFAIFGGLVYYFVGLKHRSVNFLIATEGEMKKVNWSTRREIIGSTWVVIGLVIFIGAFCWVADMAFASLFRSMNVLDT